MMHVLIFTFPFQYLFPTFTFCPLSNFVTSVVKGVCQKIGNLREAASDLNQINLASTRLVKIRNLGTPCPFFGDNKVALALFLTISLIFFTISFISTIIHLSDCIIAMHCCTAHKSTSWNRCAREISIEAVD